MLNLLKLKAAKVEAGLSVEEMAQEMGINCATLYRKFAGKTEFLLSELTVLRKLLHLSSMEFDSIFFESELAEMQYSNAKKKERN